MDLKISICGDICSECPRFIATQSNDISALEKVAELWFRLGLREKILEPEELKCGGCSKSKPCAYDLNTCEHLIGKQNCGECDIFPCDKINFAFQKTTLLEPICKEKCSKEEYKVLTRAFLMKRQILTEINNNKKTM
jgi:hypothetical protein